VLLIRNEGIKGKTILVERINYKSYGVKLARKTYMDFNNEKAAEAAL